MFRPPPGHPQVHKQFKKHIDPNVQTVSRLSAQRSVQMCHLITCKTLNTQYTAVHWKWAGVIYSEAFRLMTAMTDGLGLLMEVTIGYKRKLNNCSKSCNWHVTFWCVFTLTNFKLCTFYLGMFLKLCLNLRLKLPMPQHVVLLHKIELGCVWPHTNFVCSVAE